MHTSTLSEATQLRAQRAAWHHAATEGSRCRTCRQRGRGPPTPTVTRNLACRASCLLASLTGDPVRNLCGLLSNSSKFWCTSTSCAT